MKDNWAGDLAAGIGNGLAYLPLIVVVAFIAFGSLGPATAAVMSTSVFAAVLVAGAVLPVLARSPILIAVPSASSALVTGGLFGRFVAEGHVPDVPETMAIMVIVAAVAGAMQLALVKAGAAALGPLAPYPVVSGLINGTALLILLSQLPALLAHPFELAVALATAVTMLRFPLRWKVPQVLPAIAAGMAVNAALHAWGADTGPALTALPSPLVYPAMAGNAFATAWSHAGLLPWRDILAAGVTIALLGVLETLGTVSALTDAGIATEARRDLRSIAIANLAVAAAAGGPPASAPVASAIGLLRMGGTGRLAPIARLITLGLGGTFLGVYLPLVPQGALVGLVLAIGVRLIDPEPARLLWRVARNPGPNRLEIAGSAVISLIVVAVAVLAGLPVAVAVGAIACLLMFTAAMAGSAVRRVYDGAAALSRVRRSTAETAVLLRERRSAAVLELAGPLFFGNVSPLSGVLDQARANGARHLVIDLSNVTRVDLSGARRLIATVRQHRAQGLSVVLAPIRPGHPAADYLAALDMAPGACFAELTDAVADAESAILAEAGIAPPAFATAADALLALGIAPDHARALADRAETRDLEAGEALCHAGDPADSVFVLMRGQADVLLPGGGSGPGRVVLAHLSAGAFVGERALFEAGMRTAEVVCPVPSSVLILSGATLTALLREASPEALALVLAISRNTSMSLQLANAAIQRLEV